MKIKIFILLSLCSISLDMFSWGNLSDNQTIEFQNKVRQKIEEFQNSISIIVNNDNMHDIRKTHVNNLLKLFIGEGAPYDYYDEADTRVHNTGVKIHISSAYNKANHQSQKLKNYIYKLYNPETGTSISKSVYTKIVIESASVVRIDNIEKVGDHYECVAHFYQKFVGYRDGKVCYSDMTVKKIRCYIKQIDMPTGKRNFDVKLGDIYCTKKYSI